jgi:tetratricopeptide (TPR) repeat protein
MQAVGEQKAIPDSIRNQAVQASAGLRHQDSVMVLLAELDRIADSIRREDFSAAETIAASLGRFEALTQPLAADSAALSKSISDARKRLEDFRRIRSEGMAHYEARLWKQAAQLLQQASELRPSDELLIGLRDQTRRLAEQEQQLRKQLQTIASEVQKHNKAKKYEEAMKQADEGLRLADPNFSLEAEINSIQKAKSIAVAAWIEKTLPVAGKALKSSERKKAEELYRKILELDPKHEAATKSLARLKANSEEAITEVTDRPARPPIPEKKIEPKPAPPAEHLAWRKYVVAGVAAAVVIVGLVIGLWNRNTPGPEQNGEPKSTNAGGTAVVKPPEIVKPVPAAELQSVILNALPWASVKITPKSAADKMPAIPRDLATPCLLMLPPGEYNVELSNNISKPLKQAMTVRAGITNQFTFRMPAYDAQKIVAQVGGPE